MRIYTVANWSEKFETCESRKLSNLTWVATPNKHDGLSFRKMASQKNRCELFSAWNLILQVASKSKKGERGRLIRDGQGLTPDDLSMMTGFPISIFETAFEFFSSPRVGWLIIEDQQLAKPPANPGDNAGNLASGQDENPGTVQDMTGHYTEGNGSNKANAYSLARVALSHLNETAERSFRETGDNLKIAAERIREVGGDIEGVKVMISRQCKLWMGTEFEKFLRPETLFRRSKFNSYYDDRNQPIITNGKPGSNISRTTIAQQRNAQISGAERIREEIKREAEKSGPHGATPDFLADEESPIPG
jgi:uncharacterized phage protein (TIGR02220 family)